MSCMTEWKRISELARRFLGDNSNRFTYWEAEGLCKMERTPTVLVPGVLVVPTLSQREYCVRR
jgi:hypothetical protein